MHAFYISQLLFSTIYKWAGNPGGSNTNKNDVGGPPPNDRPFGEGDYDQSATLANAKLQTADNILFKLWKHFQIGEREDFLLDASTLDFSGTSQKELKIKNPEIGEVIPVNLFDAGINENSLAFGKVDMIYKGNDQFEIKTNTFDFDYQKKATWQRNLGTFIGGASVGDIYSIPGGWGPMLRNMLGWGGKFDVKFIGTIHIPK